MFASENLKILYWLQTIFTNCFNTGCQGSWPFTYWQHVGFDIFETKKHDRLPAQALPVQLKVFRGKSLLGGTCRCRGYIYYVTIQRPLLVPYY